MPRSANEIMAEAYRLSAEGRLTFSDWQRLWHEKNDLVQQRTDLQDWQRADLMSGIIGLAQDSWPLQPPRPEPAAA